MAITKEITCIVGTYTNKDGQEKKRYQRIGSIISTRNGEMIKLDVIPLKEGGWDVVALEFDFVLVASLNGSGEDGIDGEEEEVMITGGGIRGCCIGRGRSHFHSAEAGGHPLEAVVWEELELEEQEESVVDSVGWDVGLLDELECFVSNEHLLHLLS